MKFFLLFTCFCCLLTCLMKFQNIPHIYLSSERGDNVFLNEVKNSQEEMNSNSIVFLAKNISGNRAFFGTGSVLDEGRDENGNKYILTAKHLLFSNNNKENEEFFIYDNKRNFIGKAIPFLSPDIKSKNVKDFLKNDILLLKISENSESFKKIKGLKISEKRSGNLLSMENMQGKIGFNPGLSGSPVLNSNGEIIGVACGFINKFSLLHSSYVNVTGEDMFKNLKTTMMNNNKSISLIAAINDNKIENILNVKHVNSFSKELEKAYIIGYPKEIPYIFRGDVVSFKSNLYLDIIFRYNEKTIKEQYF